MDVEEILIQQYDCMIWYNGGVLFFGFDEMLYIFVGDEGYENMCDIFIQCLDGGFFSGILRIDVDNDVSCSYFIICQFVVNVELLEGWFGIFSQGYMIFNDNFWLSFDG